MGARLSLAPRPGRAVSAVLSAIIGFGVGGLAVPAEASYAFYVGRALSAQGSVLVGGNGEEVSSHWLAIVPRREYPHGATFEGGITSEARIPGERITIPQVRETFRYISMFYSDFAGFPPPLTNGGLNEHQVAVRDVWAPSRRELVAMTAAPQHGLSYSDLARLVLERAKTAREAVALIGALVERYGYATYGGNTHLIADPKEGWVVWELAGGQGLWVAERLGPHEVRALYPGYIETLPPDFPNNPDYMGAKHLIDFAVKQGWYEPASGKPFNVHAVYGLQGAPAREPRLKHLSPRVLEERLEALAPVTVKELMALVRDPRLSDDEAGYGEVAALRSDVPAELALLWVAPTGAITAPFLPWWIGVRDVPPEYAQHRYLTKNAARTFLNPDHQMQEASVFVGRVYKRLLYYTCRHPRAFLPLVTQTLEGFEAGLLADQASEEATARHLIEAGRRDLAVRHLTLYSHSKAATALTLGESLVGGIEAMSRARFGMSPPPRGEINLRDGQTVNCFPDADPDRPEKRHRSWRSSGFRQESSCEQKNCANNKLGARQ